MTQPNDAVIRAYAEMLAKRDKGAPLAAMDNMLGVNNMPQELPPQPEQPSTRNLFYEAQQGIPFEMNGQRQEIPFADQNDIVRKLQALIDSKQQQP